MSTNQVPALNGSRHLVYLLDHDMAKPHASTRLEKFYSTRLLRGEAQGKIALKPGSMPEEPDGRERLLLEKEDGRELGEILEAPGIAIEVERAVLQIRKKLEAEQQPKKQARSENDEKKSF